MLNLKIKNWLESVEKELIHCVGKGYLWDQYTKIIDEPTDYQATMTNHCTRWPYNIIITDPDKLLFPEEPIQKGKWYKGNNKVLVYIEEVLPKGWAKVYGFNISGDWISGPDSKGFTKGWTEASQEYVQSRMISEAEKRGFLKKGVTHDDVYQRKFKNNKVKGDLTFISSENNELLYSNEAFLFANGKWAAVIYNDEDFLKSKSIRSFNSNTSELRDKFATAAMVQMMDTSSYEWEFTQGDVDKITKRAYSYSDAMLKARECSK